MKLGDLSMEGLEGAVCLRVNIGRSQESILVVVCSAGRVSIRELFEGGESS
jgi:hypothetical protein